MTDAFVKRRSHGPGFFAWEAAGLRWLREATASEHRRPVRAEERSERGAEQSDTGTLPGVEGCRSA
jgi:hypothetical protein